MARNQQQAGVGKAFEHLPVCFKNDLILAGMGAGGNPDLPALQLQRLAQLGRGLLMVRRQNGVKLDAAQGMHLGGVGAQGHKPPGLVGILAGNQRHLPQQRSRKVGKSAVGPRRPLRKAGVDRHHGDAALLGGVYQVGPKLRLHQHQQPRLHPVQEPTHRKTEVVGRIAMRGQLAQPSPRFGSACRRHGGDQERHGWIFRRQRLNNRRDGDGLPGGDSVKPDRTRGRFRRRTAESGAKALPITRLSPAPPPKPQQDKRQGQPKQSLVNELSHGNRIFGCMGIGVQPCRGTT